MWLKSIFSHSVGCHFTLLLPLLSRIFFFFFGLYHLLVIFFAFVAYTLEMVVASSWERRKWRVSVLWGKVSVIQDNYVPEICVQHSGYCQLCILCLACQLFLPQF